MTAAQARRIRSATPRPQEEMGNATRQRGRKASHAGTLSIRLIWAFLRVDPVQPGPEQLASEGIDLRALADPETRVSHAVSMDLLERALARSGDRWLGLRAGENLESGDFGLLEYASRSCATVREAIACLSRYFLLINDAIATSLEEKDDRATLRLTVTDGVKQHPCANDFQLAAGATFSRRLTGKDPNLLEVHFAHAEPPSVTEYQRVFQCKLKFGKLVNAFVFRRSYLEEPLRFANPSLRAAYQIHAEEALRRIESETNVVSRVRRAVVNRLRTGDISLKTISRELDTSSGTLRRQLSLAGTRLGRVVDQVRRELSLDYLGESSLSVAEVGFLLGFGTVQAFYKAFHRWYPRHTPVDVRLALRQGRGHQPATWLPRTRRSPDGAT